MIQVKDYEKEKIVKWLSDQGHITLNIRGVIRNTELKVYTDDVNTPHGVYIKDDYFYYIYAKTVEFVKSFDETLTASFIGFSGTNAKVKEYYARKLLQWQNPCHQYHYPEADVEAEALESLALSDAEFVNEHYEYSHDYSIYEIRKAIEERPSACIREKGQLISYVMLHDDDSIGYMYTLKEHRGKGHALRLTKSIVQKTIESRRLPYIQIVHGNQPSIGLAKKAGFEFHGDVYWFGIINMQGEESQSFVKQYQDLYGVLPESVCTKLTLDQEAVLEGVELKDDVITYNQNTYSYQVKEDDGLYMVYVERIPDQVLKAALYGMMSQEDHVALINRKVSLKGFHNVN